MQKTTIVINGPGGTGKDALIASITNHNVINTSSIDPIKEIATICGWNGEKDDNVRKFLSDLKALTINFNDYPTNWIMNKYKEFMEDECSDILFVHIREPEEIQKFVNLTNAKTLLVSPGNRAVHEGSYGNRSDDEVMNYNYDYIFINEGDFEKEKERFCNFIETIIAE